MQEPSSPPKDLTPKGPPRVITAETIFQGSREALIDFAGARYRLRITRKNKLILQK